mgnify:CR=1 FL=1
MKNIGCVIYTETKNGIKAEYVFCKNNAISRGTGIGIRLIESKLKKRFEGAYEIIYTDINGIKSPKLKLIISLELGCYKLSWSNNEETIGIGIGIEKDNKLSVGWIEIEEGVLL